MIYEIERNIAKDDTVTTCQVIWAVDFCMIDLDATSALQITNVEALGAGEHLSMGARNGYVCQDNIAIFFAAQQETFARFEQERTELPLQICHQSGCLLHCGDHSWR